MVHWNGTLLDYLVRVDEQKEGKNHEKEQSKASEQAAFRACRGKEEVAHSLFKVSKLHREDRFQKAKSFFQITIWQRNEL